MPRRIMILDQVTVNKIAAGEVVEAPASIVKELVENCLDAGAGRIELQLDGGGIDRITVSDDGIGMSREDAEIAFTRHSTSKISDVEDLEGLSTLGFRGEALASISSVANVEMLTRAEASDAGTRIVVSAGRMITLEEAGCPRGTRITVTDLFENVPARKKFLKSVQAEKARCTDVFQRIMLVNHSVSFKMVVDGEDRLKGEPTEDPRRRAAEVLGIKTAKSMREIICRNHGIVNVEGLISLPWETRSNSGGITISVDGRIIRNKAVVEAIRRGYGSRLMKGRFPIALIFIKTGRGQVDANVHPTKDIVKFGNEAAVMNTVESAVSATLFQGKTPFRNDTLSGRKESDECQERGPFLEKAARKQVDRSPRQVPLMEGEVRPQEGLAAPWNGAPFIEGMDSLPPALPEDRSRSRIRIIGQLDRSYILCEIGSDLLMVDQHAAHERIRLEMLKKRWQNGQPSTQELLEPINIEIDPSSLENLGNMDNDLRELGFIFESFGNDMITVRGLPQFLGRIEGHEVLRDMISGNEHHEGCSYPDESFKIELPIKERITALTACRGAIKAHRKLSLKEMEDLLEELLECEVPLHCAHGRPTMVRLPLSVLERWFKRVI
jgi:DNA mismatch repair protein MutL